MNISDKDEELIKYLKNSKTVAVVGLSNKPDRASYRVAEFLKNQGYQVIPVNPTLDEVLGVKAYPSLKDIPEKVDIVDVFRRSEEVEHIAQEAIAIGAQVLWLQEGIINQAAAQKADEAGMQVVMDRCMLKEINRLSL